MSTQREVLQQAAPAVLSATQMRALQDARTTAVHWTAKARVPECGEFGRIAQDLDWLVNELAAPQQEVQEPEREWQGLTDDEIYECEKVGAIHYQRHKCSVRGQQLTPADDPQWHFAGAIEAKLKEKNERTY